MSHDILQEFTDYMLEHKSVHPEMEALYRSFYLEKYNQTCEKGLAFKDWRELNGGVYDVEATNLLPDFLPDFNNFEKTFDFHMKCQSARICQISCVFVTDRKTGVEKYSQQGIYNIFVNPQIPIPAESTFYHHITDEDVKDAPVFGEIAGDLLKHILSCDYIAAYNGIYDSNMTNLEFLRVGVKPVLSIVKPVLDPLIFARKESDQVKARGGKQLANDQGSVAKRYGVTAIQKIANKIGNEHLHNSLVDTLILAELLFAMGRNAIPWELGISLEDQNKASADRYEYYRRNAEKKAQPKKAAKPRAKKSDPEAT